jgi:hypothetical protein
MSRTLRWFSSLFAGAIALHQLRYLIGPGADAQHTVGHAHAYLPLATAFVALLVGASMVHFASTLAIARSGELPPPKPTRFVSAWPRVTLGLLAIFVTQESFEGALVAGHSSGLHGLFGHGGWIVLLLAPLLGALVALFLRGAQSVLAAVARRAALRRARPVARSRWTRLPEAGFSSPSVLASHLAGRSPPVRAFS